MSAIKTTPKVTLSDEAKEFAASKHLDAALSAALQLAPDYFPGAVDLDLSLYSEADEQSEPRLALDISTSMERSAFRSAVTEFYKHLRQENNPVHFYLAVTKN